MLFDLLKRHSRNCSRRRDEPPMCRPRWRDIRRSIKQRSQGCQRVPAACLSCRKRVALCLLLRLQCSRLGVIDSTHGFRSTALRQDAIVGAESDGLRLADVRAGVGDVVKHGQTLAQFAPDTVRADLAQQAEAALAEAETNAVRARTLQDSGAVSTQQINQYVTAAKTAAARLQSAKAVRDG